MKKSHKKWSDKEIKYLTDNFGNKSIPTMASSLNRSENAIILKSQRLGLGTFLDAGEYVSFNQLIKLLGIKKSGYRYTSWIKERNFPAIDKKINKCSFKAVSIEKFWEWAEKNQDILDFSKMEENALPPEPRWAKEKRRRDFKNNYNYLKAKWSKGEDERLERLLKQNKYTIQELSTMLNRTCGAITRRILDLNLEYRPIKAKSKDWSSEELKVISDGIKKGYRYEEISELLNNRSTKAIRGIVYRWYKTENLDKVRMIMEKIKNKSKNVKIIAEALRCSSTPISDKNNNCDKCKYRVLEEVNDKLPCPADIEIDGKGYWESCDCDQICKDAADLLEELLEMSK